MTGSKEVLEQMPNATRKIDRRASVEEIEQPPTDQSKPNKKVMASFMAKWISKFCDVFPNLLIAFTKFEKKYGPLSTNKAMGWDGITK